MATRTALALEHLLLRLRPLNRALQAAVEHQSQLAAQLIRPDVTLVRPRVDGDAVRAGIKAQRRRAGDRRNVQLRPLVPQRGDLVEVDGELGHVRFMLATSSISLRGQPMSPTVISPVYCFDAGLAKPAFSATKVTVRVARMQAPSASPVSQSRPLGTSTARTGMPKSLI